MKRFNLRLFSVLFVLGIIGAASILPYSLTVSRLAGQSLDVSVTLIAVSFLVQSAILLGVAAALGVYLSRRTGWTLRYLEPLVNREVVPAGFWKSFVGAFLSGLLVGCVVVIIDGLVFQTPLSDMSAILLIPMWQRLLAAVYGGVVEELLMRYALLALFVWLFSRVLRSKTQAVSPVAAWTGIIVGSVFFSLIQLVFSVRLVDITFLDVLHLIVLSGMPGMVFGYMFWKRGLEMAMVSHFASNFALFLLIPPLLSFF